MPKVLSKPVQEAPAVIVPKPLRRVERDEIERPRLQWHGAFQDQLMSTLDGTQAMEYRATLVVIRFLEMLRQRLYEEKPNLRLRTITNPELEVVSAWVERRTPVRRGAR